MGFLDVFLVQGKIIPWATCVVLSDLSSSMCRVKIKRLESFAPSFHSFLFFFNLLQCLGNVNATTKMMVSPCTLFNHQNPRKKAWIFRIKFSSNFVFESDKLSFPSLYFCGKLILYLKCSVLKDDKPRKRRRVAEAVDIEDRLESLITRVGEKVSLILFEDQLRWG